MTTPGSKEPYETPLSLVELLNAIADEATSRHHDHQSDETLVECHVCGEWEGHTDECPIPAIQKWLASWQGFWHLGQVTVYGCTSTHTRQSQHHLLMRTYG